MNDQQHTCADALTPCVHADDPKACYRVRCQLGGKCVDDDMSPRQPAAAPISPEQAMKAAKLGYISKPAPADERDKG